MRKRDARAEVFWDEVFTGGKTDWVKDHPPEHFLGVLGLAGPFAAELAAAQTVLDVGPGRGRLLDACPDKRRLAVEISAVNRRLLASRGTVVFAPGEAMAAVVDLAWSVSCFPHCDASMQGVLLAQVCHFLRPGGTFYLEHVSARPGFPDCRDEDRLPAGRHCADPARVALEWLLLASPGGSFTWVERSLGDDCPVRGWVARCEK